MHHIISDLTEVSIVQITKFEVVNIFRQFLKKWHLVVVKWGLCALRHGIQNSMEAILACYPDLSTE